MSLTVGWAPKAVPVAEAAASEREEEATCCCGERSEPDEIEP